MHFHWGLQKTCCPIQKSLKHISKTRETNYMHLLIQKVSETLWTYFERGFRTTSTCGISRTHERVPNPRPWGLQKVLSARRGVLARSGEPSQESAVS